MKPKSLTKKKISSLCDALLPKSKQLLEYFGVDWVEFPNRLAFACPIHGGDNPEGCCIFTDGESNVGNWSCWTNHCEEEHVGNLFGFVRGCLKRHRNKDISMIEAASFICWFLDTDIEDIESRSIDRSSRTIDIFNREVIRKESQFSRSSIRNKLSIPSVYFKQRGYDDSVLETFDVGECTVENQPMSGRVVVPLYDECNNYVGCVGRAIKESLQPKWLHSKGFNKNILYGLNHAKESILNTRTAILVEGQGDVWRAFEAGLDMTVGIFGTSLSEDQLILLESSGALNLVILTDYDQAGKKAADSIVKKCGRRFNYIRPDLDGWFKDQEIPEKNRDLGIMSVEDIQEQIFPYLPFTKEEE